jgi:hypothetical protein
MKLIHLALLLMSSQSFATTVLKVKCTALDLPYINRFSLEESFEVYPSTTNKDEWNLIGANINIEATRSGNTSEPKNSSLKKLRGTLKKIEGQFTKLPYYNLKLKSSDKLVLVNLNVDYPAKLSSSIRTADKYLYKSTCKLVEFKQCLFHGSFYEILEEPKIVKVELGEELKVIPDFSDENFAVNTKKVSLTYPNGQTFNAWYTFEDDVDGGNTYGVIETLEGKVAATINDSDINNCSATK